jgi:hypothetical protein
MAASPQAPLGVSWRWAARRAKKNGYGLVGKGETFAVFCCTRFWRHPRGSLAFAAWVIARFRGWPALMRRGLDDFQRIKYGTSLRLQHV